ncbi:MAG: GerAB/ArcD/ProY family transporter [Bacillota bacterium]
MNHKERISELQMAVLIGAGIVELGLYSFPRDLVEGAGRQHFLALAVTLLLGLLSALVMAKVILYFGRQSGIQTTLCVFGRPLGLLLVVPAIAFHIALAAICLRYFGDLMNTYFLPRTPPEAVMLLIILSVVFITGQGMAATARLATLMVPAFIGVVVLAYLLVTYKMTEWGAVFPAMRLWPPTYLSGSLQIIYLIVGLESIAIFLPMVGKVTRPYFWVAVPTIVNGIVLVIVAAVTYGVMGLEPVAQLYYPGVAVLRTLRLPGLLVERTGALIALAWTVLKICYVAVRFLTVPMALCTCFGLPMARYRIFLLPLAILTFFLARWPANSVEVSYLLENWIGPLGLLFNVIFALLVWLVGWALGKGVTAA